MSKLIRQKDGLTREGFIEYVEFKDNDRGRDIHMFPKVGYSCIINRNLVSCTWLTSKITKVVSNTEFYTINSHYKIEN